jgi:hypothetical protein
MAFMFLIVGSLFIAANPAPVECEPEIALTAAIVGDDDGCTPDEQTLGSLSVTSLTANPSTGGR